MNVIYGSNEKLSRDGDQIWMQQSSGMRAISNANELFGYAMTAADYNGDGFADLTIGSPSENTAIDPYLDGGGMLHILHGRSQGLRAFDSQVWHRNKLGVPGHARSLEAFGLVL